MGILLGGLLAGILDLAAAVAITLWYGGSPVRMSQGIASGALGRAAFEGGARTALLGAAFHFLLVQRLAGMDPKFTPVSVTRAVLVHIFCVGLPIALSVKRYALTGNPPARPA